MAVNIGLNVVDLRHHFPGVVLLGCSEVQGVKKVIFIFPYIPFFLLQKICKKLHPFSSCALKIDDFLLSPVMAPLCLCVGTTGGREGIERKKKK